MSDLLTGSGGGLEIDGALKCGFGGFGGIGADVVVSSIGFDIGFAGTSSFSDFTLAGGSAAATTDFTTS